MPKFIFIVFFNFKIFGFSLNLFNVKTKNSEVLRDRLKKKTIHYERWLFDSVLFQQVSEGKFSR